MNTNLFCHVFSFITELKHPPVTLTSVGHEIRHTPDYYYDNTYRQMRGVLFQYTLRGSGYIQHGSTLHAVGRNQGFFVPIPSDTRYFCDLKTSEPWEFVFIHIDAPALTEYIEKIVEKNGYVLNLPQESLPIQLLFDIANQTYNGHVDSFHKASRLGFEFMTHLYDYFFENQEIYSKRNRDIITYMEHDFRHIESIAQIAEKFEISSSHLTRDFLHEVGISPIKYLTKVRIQHAKKLLQTTNLTVNEIADACGYEQTNYFCKVFKTVVGQTPLQYRNYLY